VRFLKHNGLSIFFLVILLAAVAGNAVAGHAKYNDDERAHAKLEHQQPELLSLGRYVTSSEFGNEVLENWQSEYLQFFLYVFTTVWLLQRGSPESKPLDKAGLESDEEQLVGRYAKPDSPKWAKAGGWRTTLFSNSLLLVMGAIWIACWLGQAATGWSSYNADQIEHHDKVVNFLGYLGTADFWDASLQNWQSEFLAVGSFAVLSIFLRQRGSSESKAVGAPHDQTGT
jgi:hypothetical protein